MDVDGPDTESAQLIMTIGHSTRTLVDFLQRLQAHRVTLLVDIRTIPRSRYNPQFNQDTFPDALKTAGIGYAHLAALGGLRNAQPDSINTGWRNRSFRGFADYMQTEAFDAGIALLLKLAAGCCAAVMCAEAVPWRCHRSLVADALGARGLAVTHLMSPTGRSSHTLNPMATIRGLRVTYPSQEGTEAPRGRTTRKKTRK